MVISMCHSVKNYFSKSKSHSLKAAHDQKISLAQKRLVHTALLGQNIVCTNSTSGKKNLKKTYTPIRTIKKPREGQ